MARLSTSLLEKEYPSLKHLRAEGDVASGHCPNYQPGFALELSAHSLVHMAQALEFAS